MIIWVYFKLLYIVNFLNWSNFPVVQFVESNDYYAIYESCRDEIIKILAQLQSTFLCITYIKRKTVIIVKSKYV